MIDSVAEVVCGVFELLVELVTPLVGGERGPRQREEYPNVDVPLFPPSSSEESSEPQV